MHKIPHDALQLANPLLHRASFESSVRALRAEAGA